MSDEPDHSVDGVTTGEREPSSSAATVTLDLSDLSRWRYDDLAQQDYVAIEQRAFTVVVFVRYRSYTAVICTRQSSGHSTIELHDHGTPDAAQRFLRETVDTGYTPRMALDVL